MNCKRAKLLCNQLLDEEITPREKEMLLWHLKNCPECARFYEETKKLKKALSSIYTPSLSPSFNRNVLREIKSREEKILRPLSPLLVFKKVAVFLLPIFLLLSLLFGVYTFKPREDKFLATLKREHIFYTTQNPLISGDSTVKLLLIAGEE
ncbi:zf-HC2 domain-containing protein [bacterium]|nr:zf-HC2 domain-containing protein [bacterium]